MTRIKYIVALLNTPRFIFHSLFYALYRSKIKEDVAVGMSAHKIVGNEFLGLLYLLTFDKTFRNLFYYRIGHLKYFISFVAPPHNSFVIATYSEIGKGFLGVHPIGTFVNAKRIGNFFTVKNNVTIGHNHEKAPSFGDNVTVNSGAIVVGDITIGDNVQIGAGSVVTKSVPANCVVVGNPAQIIRENGVRVNKRL